MTSEPTIVAAFDGDQLLAEGPAEAVFAAVRRRLSEQPEALPMVFDDRGERVEAEPAPRSRGRPRLGVAAREVTLLPRHWDWLAVQPGGASAALRRLVEAARRDPDEMARAAREAAWRFMGAVGGDRPGYEAAGRALFAGSRTDLESALAAWPADLATYALRLAGPGLEVGS